MSNNNQDYLEFLEMLMSLPQVPTVLPQVPTVLPQVPTVLSQVPTVLPQVPIQRVMQYTNVINTQINPLLSSLYDKPVYKYVIEEDELNKLEKIVYNKELSDKYNKSCPIMQLDFEEGEEIIKLECNHCFNEEAILKWLKEEKAECPVCRHQFKSKEIKNEEYEILETGLTNNIINLSVEEDILIERNNFINSLSTLVDLYTLTWGTQVSPRPHPLNEY